MAAALFGGMSGAPAPPPPPQVQQTPQMATPQMPSVPHPTPATPAIPVPQPVVQAPAEVDLLGFDGGTTSVSTVTQLPETSVDMLAPTPMVETVQEPQPPVQAEPEPTPPPPAADPCKYILYIYYASSFHAQFSNHVRSFNFANISCCRWSIGWFLRTCTTSNSF